MVTASFRTPASDSRQEVRLSLPAYASAFVILSEKEGVQVINQEGKQLKETAGKGFVESYPHQMEIAGNWQVHFDDIQKDTTVALPFDWSKATDEKIRYYSGHASFTTSFIWKTVRQKNADVRQNNPDKMDAAGDDVKICLGNIGDVAQVWVNGKSYGYAWTAPYEVSVPKHALRKGRNELRIVVANTWHNALQGAAEGKAPFEGIWTNAKYRTKSKKLLPAGLFNPIIIKY